MSTALLACRLLLAAVFLVAGLAKLADRRGSRSALADFGLPGGLAGPGAILLPLAELCVAIALLPQSTAWWGAVGALALLVAFIVAISVSLARGQTPECHCFGQIHSAPASWWTVGRNGVLAAAAAFLVASGPGDVGPSVFGWLSDLGTAGRLGVAGGIVLLAALAVVGWLLLTLLRQNGRLLLRIEALERQSEHDETDVAEPQVGLAVGVPAPSFELRGLDSAAVSLDQMLAAGRPVLLVFVEPGCGPCHALLPDVRRWSSEHSERLTVALIGRDDPEVRKAAKDGRLRVLLQADREVALDYEVPATPGAVLVAPTGTVASRVALGSKAIRKLVSRAITTRVGAAPPSDANGAGQGSARLSARRVPAFRLPDLTGAPFELSDFQGSETLLVFWDPDSAACRKMTADLKDRERAHPIGPPKLVILSRGSVESNRAMGLSSLILLDEASEVARALHAHATPAGVLLDARANLASPVVFGSDAILELADRDATVGRSA